LYQALVALSSRSFEKILAAINALDVKLLASLNAVLLPEFGGQDDLSASGNDGFHW
jgi:hypothetical protein